MTEGLRKQIERANRLMADRPKMKVIRCGCASKISPNSKFDLKELNKHLLHK